MTLAPASPAPEPGGESASLAEEDSASPAREAADGSDVTGGIGVAGVADEAVVTSPAPAPAPAPAPGRSRAAARAARAAAAAAEAAAAHRVAFAWVDESAVTGGVAVPPRPPLPTMPAADAAAGAAAVAGPILAGAATATDASAPTSVITDTAAATTPVAVWADADLLPRPPRRSPWRPGVLIPVGIIAALIGAYCAATLMWPLHALQPTVTPTQVDSLAAPVAAPAWPAAGSAAVAVDGISGLSSSSDAVPIASITKVVTALLVLDEMPLAVGEQGPDFRFTAADRTAYWSYRSDGESALDVPVGGSLSEYQLLEGMLVGSANNYADRLAGNLWPSNRVFADAAQTWLTAHGVPGVQIVDPTGIEPGNTAAPEALIPLAQRALENPVIAQIVAQKSIELPGAGIVSNTNGLLADAGVIGVKTGSLDSYNLLSAKDITVGDTTVRLYASVLGQPDDAARVDASRALYAQLEKELQPLTAVAAGTVAGEVTTRWGETVDIVTTADAPVILWNGGSGTVTTTYALGDARAGGDAVGSLAVAGPLDTTTVDLALAADIPDPSPWWRLTHPLDLFGISG